MKMDDLPILSNEEYRLGGYVEEIHNYENNLRQ